jgi:hypothetical protein
LECELDIEKRLEEELEKLRTKIGGDSIITPSPLLTLDDDISDILRVRDKLLSHINDGTVDDELTDH